MLYRELVDHLAANSPASYTFILSRDLKLVQLMDSLPSFFVSLFHHSPKSLLLTSAPCKQTNTAGAPDDPQRPNVSFLRVSLRFDTNTDFAFQIIRESIFIGIFGDNRLMRFVFDRVGGKGALPQS